METKKETIELSKKTLRNVFYLLLACVISWFGGYRYANYKTVKYIETNYPVKDVKRKNVYIETNGANSPAIYGSKDTVIYKGSYSMQVE